MQRTEPLEQLQGLLAGLRDGELAPRREQLLALARAGQATAAQLRQVLERCRSYFEWPDSGYLQVEYRRLFNTCRSEVAKALDDGQFAIANSPELGRCDGAIRAAARALLSELARYGCEDGRVAQAATALEILLLGEFPAGYAPVVKLGLAAPEKISENSPDQP